VIGRKSIAKEESENLEFKLKIDEEIGKVVCTFANSNGGTILIGVDNKGNVIGCSRKEEEKIALTNLVKRGIFRSVGKGRRELKYILVLGHYVPKMSQKVIREI